jgi:hypothetical protein
MGGMVVRTGFVATCVLVVLLALVVAVPVLAQSHDRATFRVGQPVASTCAGFFSSVVDPIEGWNGELHETATYDAPLYSDIKVLVHGTFTDDSTGLSYRIRFNGREAGPTPNLVAPGDVTIRRSDGRTLQGAAEFVGDMDLVNLDSVDCS